MSGGRRAGSADKAAEIEEEGNEHADHPAYGPGTPDADGTEQPGKRDGQDNAEQEIGERGNHEGLHKTCTAQHAVRDKLGGDGKIEGRDNAQEKNAGGQRILCRRLQEEAHEDFSEEEVKQEKRNAEDEHHFQSRVETGMDPLFFPCAEILGGIVGDAVAQCCQAGDDQIIEFDGGRISDFEANVQVRGLALESWR